MTKFGDGQGTVMFLLLEAATQLLVPLNKSPTWLETSFRYGKGTSFFLKKTYVATISLKIYSHMHGLMPAF